MDFKTLVSLERNLTLFHKFYICIVIPLLKLYLNMCWERALHIWRLWDPYSLSTQVGAAPARPPSPFRNSFQKGSGSAEAPRPGKWG